MLVLQESESAMTAPLILKGVLYRVENLAFLEQIVKIWPFSKVVWQQIFSLTFLNIFENLAEYWPLLPVLPHSGISTLKRSPCTRLQAHFPF